MENTFEGFKKMLISKISRFGVEISEKSETELKVEVDGDNYFYIDLKMPWDKFLETDDADILHNFHRTQIEIIEWVLKKDYTYETCKEKLLYVVRSASQLSDFDDTDSIISEQLGEDLYGVVFLKHPNFSEYLNREQIIDAPSIEQIIDEAKENTFKRGWCEAGQVHSDWNYKILVFNGHLSHYQFLISDWVDKELGDCFISFPSNRVALVLKFNEDTNWKDKVEGLEKFTEYIETCSLKSKMPLSTTIVQFKDKKYEFIAKA